MKEKKYVIIKEMIQHGKPLKVLMLDGMSEVLEFEDKAKAEEFAKILQINSDSEWSYKVREI